MEDKENYVIELNNVSKSYVVFDHGTESVARKVWGLLSFEKRREITVLKDVNLKVKKGEFLGIIGRNGAGKSTLLNIISGAVPPNKGGKVTMSGKYIRLSLGMGFNPELSARQNVYLNASLLGMPKKQIDLKIDEIIAFSELNKFIDTPIKFFSSGMRSRLAFAVAIHAQADIFLMDEVFGGVGDEVFKQKADEMFEQKLLTGRTIVHVSHNLNTIKKYCDRVAIIHNNKLLGPFLPEVAIRKYKKLLGG